MITISLPRGCRGDAAVTITNYFKAIAFLVSFDIIPTVCCQETVMSLSNYEREHVKNGGKLFVVKEDENSRRWHVVDVNPSDNKLVFDKDGFELADQANNAALSLVFTCSGYPLVRTVEADDWKYDCRDYI